MKNSFRVRRVKAFKLDEVLVLEIERSIVEMFEEKQRYKMLRYSLNLLSRETGFTRNQLSAFFNQVIGVRFNDYINTLRVNFFKRMAASSEAHQYTLAALAEKSGFYNRNTFTDAFTKLVGIPPSLYMRQNAEARDQLLRTQKSGSQHRGNPVPEYSLSLLTQQDSHTHIKTAFESLIAVQGSFSNSE